MAANNKCSDCGKDREEKYENDSCCKECRSNRNKAKRVANMAAKGKRPYGSGRSPNCSKCGKPKGESFLTSGYCRECKLESVSTRRAKARIERGQRPFGEGRSYNCYKCGKLKENEKHGYCNACHAAKIYGALSLVAGAAKGVLMYNGSAAIRACFNFVRGAKNGNKRCRKCRSYMHGAAIVCYKTAAKR